MSEPFWRDLVRQDKLEAQYEVLVNRGTFTDKEIALHLARFAEAHIFNAAQRRVEELERINKGLLKLNDQNVNDAMGRIRAGDAAMSLALLMNDGIVARDARIAELERQLEVQS